MKLGVMASEEARPQGLKPRFGWRAHVAPEGATPARPKRRERRGQGRPGSASLTTSLKRAATGEERSLLAALRPRSGQALVRDDDPSPGRQVSGAVGAACSRPA